MTSYFNALRALVQPIRADAWEMTLDPMRRLLDALGSPQQNYRAVVVTGSTGKGTTCLRIAEALRASGLKVGLYTSPHLHLFRERFAIFDAASPVGARHAVPPHTITQDELVDVAERVLEAERRFDHHFSTFESATALALIWFAQQQIDVVVLEIGIGGRFDAVNAVANDLAVFTPIEAEHVAILGGSLQSVAWHKAGIIQPHGKAISVPQSPEVWTVLENEAREKAAVLGIYDDLLDGIGDLTSQPPRHYFESIRAQREGGEVSLPGRLERIRVNGQVVVVDGGHTPRAARHLHEFIGEAESIRLIVGMLRDKNVAAYLETFDAPNVHLVYTQAPSDRALSPTDLLERYRPQAAHLTLIDSLDEALSSVEQADESKIVVAGSLRMAAAAREAFGLLSPEELDEARVTHTIFEGAEYRSKLKKK